MKKKFVLVFTILLIPLLLIAYAYFIEPHRLTVRSIDIETNLSIKPTTIVFFTDTHFGKLYDSSNIEKIVDKINQEEPDIVMFGGDLFDNYARDRETIDFALIKEKLQAIDANIGKYAVWGNHDYGGGAVRMYEQFLQESGFTVLKNDQIPLVEIGINLVGFDDYLMGYQTDDVYSLDSQLFNLILSHEPIVSQYIESDSDNLILSGHTHGGQINLPYLSDIILPAGSGSFKKGLYDADDIKTSTSIHLYTSSGIGMTILPFRFMNAPEIIKINLHSTI